MPGLPKSVLGTAQAIKAKQDDALQPDQIRRRFGGPPVTFPLLCCILKTITFPPGQLLPHNSAFISSLLCLLFLLTGRGNDELLLIVPVATLPRAGPNGAFVLFVTSHHLFSPCTSSTFNLTNAALRGAWLPA